MPSSEVVYARAKKLLNELRDQTAKLPSASSISDEAAAMIVKAEEQNCLWHVFEEVRANNSDLQAPVAEALRTKVNFSFRPKREKSFMLAAIGISIADQEAAGELTEVA